MVFQSYFVKIERFINYRYRKFLQKFLAVVLALFFIGFVPGFVPSAPADEAVPSYTKPVLQILKEGLEATAEEAEAEPELVPFLDNPFVIVGLVAINVGVAWFFYSQAQQQAAQQLAQQKYYQAYCHVFKSDPLCGPVFDLSYYSPNNRGWITWRIGQGQGFLDWKIEECIWDYGGGQGPQDEGPAMITQTADGVWSDEKYGGTCNGPGVDPKTVTITPVNAQWPAWKDWPQDQRNQAVSLLTDDDWISNLQQSPQGGAFQKGNQLPKGYFAFPPDGPPQYIPGPVDVPDGPPGLIPNPSPSDVPGSSPPPAPSPSPSPAPSPGSSPPPDPSPSPSPSSSPPMASGGSPSPSPSPSPPTTSSGTTEPSLPPDPSREPGGTPADIPPKAAPDNVRSLTRENEVAKLFARAGYNVEQIDPYATTETGPKPDYKIEGNTFDCYAPTSGSAKNIRNELKRKVDKQSERLVLDLDDSPASYADIQAELAKKPVPGLKELFGVKNGTITRLFP